MARSNFHQLWDAAEITMSNKKYRVIQDPIYGYRRLDPLPDKTEIAKFYQSQYYDLIRKGGCAPELHRFMAGGEEAGRERAWLRTVLYSDITYVLNQYAPGNRVLDVGCGTGEFLVYLKENGFEGVGIEPSSDVVAIAKSQGLAVYSSTLEEFAENYKSSANLSFDVVTLLNVLEHVPNPMHIIEITKVILNPGGILFVRVPNDFSEIQLAAQKQLNKEPWWVAIPDHLNYFDFESLHALLERLSFEVIYSQGDFPMELFLLMGDDYTGNPEVGSACHQKRVRFEMAIPGELRRRIYAALAEVEVGRSCLVFGRHKGK